MKYRMTIACLFFCHFWAAGASAGSLDEDLYWYKSSLAFSNVVPKGVDSYLNPFKGPREFRLDKTTAPWAGNYFPMIDGGIAQRWTDNTHPKEILNKKSYLKLSPEERQKLSPVEKYDVLLGLYDFRTTGHEMNFRGPLRQGAKLQDWEGFCNGVRCAGIMLPEPHFSVERTNPQGEKVVFEPADLKALAGASYFYTQQYAQIGSPSRESKSENPPHPAVFDLVLRFGLSRNNKAFIIDSHLGTQIWNETVVGYKRSLSKILPLTQREKALYPAAVRKVHVAMTLETLGEIEIKDSNKPTKTDVANGSLLKTLQGNYTLYLDQNNKAVDGRWKKNPIVRGVDFAWFVGGAGADKDYADRGGNPYLEFSVIHQLFNESVHPSCKKIFQ